MKVLVIGGTLYVGKMLVERLLNFGRTVVVSRRQIGIDSERLTQILGDRNDVATRRAAREHGPFDVCYDFCCSDHEDMGSWLELMSNCCSKIVLISSIGVYSQKAMGLRETDELSSIAASDPHIRYPYQMKIRAEQCLLDRLPSRSVVLRPTVILSEEDWTKRLHFYVWRIQDGLGVLRETYADTMIQWISAKKMCDVALSFSMPNSPPNGVYNVGYSTAFPFEAVLQHVLWTLGLNCLEITYPSPGTGSKALRDPLGKENCFASVATLSKYLNLKVDLDEFETMVNSIAKSRPKSVFEYRTSEEVASLRNPLKPRTELRAQRLTDSLGQDLANPMKTKGSNLLNKIGDSYGS